MDVIEAADQVQAMRLNEGDVIVLSGLPGNGADTAHALGEALIERGQMHVILDLPEGGFSVLSEVEMDAICDAWVNRHG